MIRNTLIIISMFTFLFCVENTKEGVLFLYENKNAESVFLVGSMNNWDQTMTPMEKDKNGIWRVILKLEPSKYSYKFFVDGNWYFDQENPNFEDDGFGGSNSIIEINKQGKLVKRKNLNSTGIKSSFNPKIYFQGRYFSNNIFTKNKVKRFMLNKPEHELDFGIRIKFGSNMEGYTLLNVNNVREGTDMWKTHLNYKRTNINLKTDYFNVSSFDNFGIITFDDPLHIVGDIGLYNYDFGYNQGGFYAETSEKFSETVYSLSNFNVKAQLLFSDVIGYEEDDVSASRIKLIRSVNKNNEFTFGMSKYSYLALEEDNNELIKDHDNYAFDFLYSKDINKDGWKDKMNLSFFGEYSAFKNSDEDSIKLVWMEGYNLISGISVAFPRALKVYTTFQKTSLNLEREFGRKRYTFGFDFINKNVSWNLIGQFWENIFYSNLDWGNYYIYIEETDGNGRWFQTQTEVPFEKYSIIGYKQGFLWESDFIYYFKIKGYKSSFNMKNHIAQYGLLYEPKLIDNNFILGVEITNKVKVIIDTRIPYYNDPFLNLETDYNKNKDVFISTFYEIAYYFSNNIWLSIGYGVDPSVINLVTDKFYDRGRQEYLNEVGQLSETIKINYALLGDKIRQAEKALGSEKQINLKAVITF